MATETAPVGSRIRALRRRNRIRLKVLARQVGITPTALVSLENGTRRISIDRLEKIARALDTTPAYLLEPDEKAAQPRPKDLRLLVAWRELDAMVQQDFSRLIADLATRRRRAKQRG